MRNGVPADNSRMRWVPILLLAGLWGITSVALATSPPVDPGLASFKAWLDQTHPKYGCDEGPGRFQNPTVEKAYPGRRFYYVLTYTRGIQPPFPNSLTMVAEVDAQGHVRPVRDVDALKVGLMKASSRNEACLAAAAVMSLSSCGERRWSYPPESFKAKRKNGGWVCSYEHGSKIYLSQVTFDRKGVLAAITGSAPPVP